MPCGQPTTESAFEPQILTPVERAILYTNRLGTLSASEDGRGTSTIQTNKHVKFGDTNSNKSIKKLIMKYRGEN
jgi:hypothetical protein